MIGEHYVELSKQIDLISNKLETVVDCGQVTLLNNELFYIIDGLT